MAPRAGFGKRRNEHSGPLLHSVPCLDSNARARDSLRMHARHVWRLASGAACCRRRTLRRRALHRSISNRSIGGVGRSYELFTLMKWAGAVYLCYLGLRLIFSAFGQTSPATPAGAPIAARRSLLGGFVLHAANPKALLYFGSLVPQFVDPARPLPSQLVTLAAIHLSTAAVVLIAYAAVSARLRYSAANAGANRIFKVAAGSSMVGAGVSMALLRKGTE
jgi:arginine exporter protein ArgO